MVALNCRFFVKPLIALILGSIVFFYVDVDPYAPHLVSSGNLVHIQTLLTTIGGLFLIHGFSSEVVSAATVI